MTHHQTVTEQNIALLSPADVAEWDAAIDEYRRVSA